MGGDDTRRWISAGSAVLMSLTIFFMAHDGIVDHDDFLPLEHTLDGIEFDAHTEVPARLRRMDERPAHVMVADEPDIEPDV